MKSAVLLFLVFSASASLTSCSSTTVMNSKPQGAKLYMDGQFKGETPFAYSDTKIVGSTTSIKLSLPGYEPFDGILSRNERADVGAIVGGCLVLVPFLWTMQYDLEHTYELTPTGTAKTTQQPDELAKKLESLKKLRDDGTITADEYETLRKKALDNVK